MANDNYFFIYSVNDFWFSCCDRSKKSKKTKNLTNDVFSDTEPSWSPDGEKIVFVSDRGIKSNSIKTTAKDMGDHYVVNGSKTFITYNSK